MSEAPFDFGNLNPVLASAHPEANLDSWKLEAREAEQNGMAIDEQLLDPENLRVQNYLRSTGPVADAYIRAIAPNSLINGPIGSAKTTASVKRALYAASCILPGPTGVRDYTLATICNGYDQLWKAAIPSWWSIFSKKLFPQWTGASPRAAEHIIEWQDQFGPVRITAIFLAFGEQTTEDDLRGHQWSDCYFPEMDTIAEFVFVNASGRVGRRPTPLVMGREGRVFGDCNAPDVTSFVYRDFFQDPKAGFQLFKQPGGRDEGAENLMNMGADYYHKLAARNAHRPDYVARMIDNIPGVRRGSRLVYENYDDRKNVSPYTLEVYPQLPIVVGIDNENNPAAAYMQFTAEGQMRVLAEIALEGATIELLGQHMLRLEATDRFANCEFSDWCDPAMIAGENAEDYAQEAGQRPKSQRERLSAVLGRRVKPAHTNDPSERRAAVFGKIGTQLGQGKPGYILDPSCKGLRRGKQQTFAYRIVRGTDDIGSIQKSFDSHVNEAEQYGALQAGEAHARKRVTDLRRDREDRQKAKREKGQVRHNPMKRRYGR